MSACVEASTGCMTTTRAPGPYRMRSITPLDRTSLTAFYAGLSSGSRAARFHGAAPHIPEATATFFCGPAPQHRGGMVAARLPGGGPREIMAQVCIEPMEDG